MKSENNDSDMNSKNELESKIEQNMGASPERQIEEAVKILHEIEDIDTHRAFDQVKRNIESSDRWNNRYYRLFMRVAAILIIPLLISSFVLARKLMKESKPEYAEQIVATPEGVRSMITLPDGTKAWLNAESTLKFRIPFNRQLREVTLSGEAFFDVAKNKQLPFIVNSGTVKIRVTGTKFDCKAYQDENDIEVSLTEGTVNLKVINAINAHAQDFSMIQGERAVVNKLTGSIEITNENLKKYTAWHTGQLMFDDALIADVAKSLSRWFGVEAEVADPSIVNYRITTTFENESLQQVIDLLKLSSPLDIQVISASIENHVKKPTKIIFRKKNF